MLSLHHISPTATYHESKGTRKEGDIRDEEGEGGRGM